MPNRELKAYKRLLLRWQYRLANSHHRNICGTSDSASIAPFGNPLGTEARVGSASNCVGYPIQGRFLTGSSFRGLRFAPTNQPSSWLEWRNPTALAGKIFLLFCFAFTSWRSHACEISCQCRKALKCKQSMLPSIKL
jgi:hypothetical protein